MLAILVEYDNMAAKKMIYNNSSENQNYCWLKLSL